MATTRNNNKFENINMAWRPIVKQVTKYGGAALVGYEIKDTIETKDTNEEKIIGKFIEKTISKETGDLSLTKTNAIIFIILLVILAYLIIKHIIKKRTNGNIARI